uniref:Methyltransferase type 11 domain-containing protein n=1 Tax=Chromera velia CCMP2878 TaxID=1169474 RepID=A0A0G4HT25_9ALVE|eukprot:Cvel_1330.t1-p1 / transcript=Cvel_1330.t1 / gene=Cvel_1330 / organism=Chromera_velia_CCMP2878 / gene_product=hypothetical protein / transcript_product=hypothetical protein / location=Cvel_scaffold45:101842-104537(+) / protein_length=701 / sequence_SO=supercontig / SO=protein_coding / is_pseudo=false
MEVLHSICSNFAAWRTFRDRLEEVSAEIYRSASGHVLEIGIGDGTRLGHLQSNRNVKSITCIDLNGEKLRRLGQRLAEENEKSHEDAEEDGDPKTLCMEDLGGNRKGKTPIASLSFPHTFGGRRFSSKRQSEATVRFMDSSEVSGGLPVQIEPSTPSPPVLMIEGDAHLLPFPDGFFDCVLSREFLCSVAVPSLVLAEAERVCKKPGGRLLLLEHGEPPPTLRGDSFGALENGGLAMERGGCGKSGETGRGVNVLRAASSVLFSDTPSDRFPLRTRESDHSASLLRSEQDRRPVRLSLHRLVDSAEETSTADSMRGLLNRLMQEEGEEEEREMRSLLKGGGSTCRNGEGVSICGPPLQGAVLSSSEAFPESLPQLERERACPSSVLKPQDQQQQQRNVKVGVEPDWEIQQRKIGSMEPGGQVLSHSQESPLQRFETGLGPSTHELGDARCPQIRIESPHMAPSRNFPPISYSSSSSSGSFFFRDLACSDHLLNSPPLSVSNESQPQTGTGHLCASLDLVDLFSRVLSNAFDRRNPEGGDCRETEKPLEISAYEPPAMNSDTVADLGTLPSMPSLSSSSSRGGRGACSRSALEGRSRGGGETCGLNPIWRHRLFGHWGGSGRGVPLRSRESRRGHAQIPSVCGWDEQREPVTCPPGHGEEVDKESFSHSLLSSDDKDCNRKLEVGKRSSVSPVWWYLLNLHT